jgi:hypothetical protein
VGHPMNIHVQFSFNHICSVWEEGIWTFAHSTIETKEVARIGHSGFIFQLSIQVKDEVRNKKCGVSNTDSFLFFNSNISKLYNNSIVAKTNGMTFIPTTTLKWVYWFIYRQSLVPFIQCQVLKITKNICWRLIE